MELADEPTWTLFQPDLRAVWVFAKIPSFERSQAMTTDYDPETDALYLRFAETPVSGSEEVPPGVVFDFDAEGRIVAGEILDASEHLASGADLRTLTAA
jgi:uncharacterized protein YuzE